MSSSLHPAEQPELHSPEFRAAGMHLDIEAALVGLPACAIARLESSNFQMTAI
jgi:hypothetical protein